MSNQKYCGTKELFVMEKLSNYNSDVVLKLAKYFKKNSQVFEFGAGIGTLAKIWRDKIGSSPNCLEIDRDLKKIICESGFSCYENVDMISKKYDYIYSSNVLEHIEDDVGSIKKLHSLLNDGGIIAIYVPAFMCLFSDMDKSVGHLRRYEKSSLLQKMREANFKIIDCYFCDSLGFFASLFFRFCGYKKIDDSSSGKSFLFYDKFIYPFSALLDRLGAKYFFGKNLIIFAQK